MEILTNRAESDAGRSKMPGVEVIPLEVPFYDPTTCTQGTEIVHPVFNGKDAPGVRLGEDGRAEPFIALPGKKVFYRRTEEGHTVDSIYS